MKLDKILGHCDPSVTDPAPGAAEVTEEQIARIAGGFDFDPILRDVTWSEGSYLLHLYASGIYPRRYGRRYEIFGGDYEAEEFYRTDRPGHWMSDDFCRVCDHDGRTIAYMHWVHGDGEATVFTVTD